MSGGRISWVDYARGLCIILMVLAAATLGPGEPSAAENWFAALSTWAQPFALPAFFLIAALFLHRSVFGARSAYFDRKVLHFVYFYAVWLALQTVLLDPAALIEAPGRLVQAYAMAWIDPAESLWVLHALILFHVVTRLIRHLHIGKVLAFAALLQVLQQAHLFATGWSVADHLAQYYVFFFAGYAFSPIVFQYARAVTLRAPDVAKTFAIWFFVHTGFVLLGSASLPVVSLVLGLAGAMALVTAGIALSRVPHTGLIGRAGRHALAIYVGYFIPMAVLRGAFAFADIAPSGGLAAPLIASASFGLALYAHRRLSATPLSVLYARPQMFRLKSAGSGKGGSLLPASMREA